MRWLAPALSLVVAGLCGGCGSSNPCSDGCSVVMIREIDVDRRRELVEKYRGREPEARADARLSPFE